MLLVMACTLFEEMSQEVFGRILNYSETIALDYNPFWTFWKASSLLISLNKEQVFPVRNNVNVFNLFQNPTKDKYILFF